MQNGHDVAAFQQLLDAAFRTFDWVAADRLVTELADLFGREPNAVNSKHAARLLNQLRRKRRFSSITNGERVAGECCQRLDGPEAACTIVDRTGK
jgi:hypothetical protein